MNKLYLKNGKEVHMGDTISVYKAGEIIPEVISVNKNRRQEGLESFTMMLLFDFQ